MEQSMGVCHVAEFQPWPGLAQNGRMISKSSSSESPDARRGPLGPPLLSQTRPGPALTRAPPEILPAEYSQRSASAPSRPPQPAPTVASGKPVPQQNRDAPKANGKHGVVHQPREPRAGPGSGARAAPSSSGERSRNDFGDERFDKLDAAISWWVDHGARDPREQAAGARGASRATTSALLCGRIPQQIADLRANTRNLAAHCDTLQVTTNHGNPYSHANNSGPSLERLEAAHATVMDVARRLLEDSGFAADAMDSASLASRTITREL